MKTNVLANYDTLCAAVADQVAEQLQRKPESVLVFPTGNTPLGLFKHLVAQYQSGHISFERAHIVVLDEYAGLAPNDSRSLTGWLERELLSHINIPKAHVHGFENGPEAMETTIRMLGGIDLVVLGLGPNGHLGFNEPGSAFDSRTRVVDLTPESITSNAAYWGSEDRVPRHGVTLGLGTLAQSRAILLMVSGPKKQGIFQKMMQDPVSPANPATMLRQLPQAQVFIDAAANGTGP
jgi:glucosamine-6-phosphate deaminase